MLDSEEEDPRVKGLNGGLQGRERQEKLDGWNNGCEENKGKPQYGPQFCQNTNIQKYGKFKGCFS